MEVSLSHSTVQVNENENWTIECNINTPTLSGYEELNVELEVRSENAPEEECPTQYFRLRLVINPSPEKTIISISAIGIIIGLVIGSVIFYRWRKRKRSALKG